MSRRTRVCSAAVVAWISAHACGQSFTLIPRPAGYDYVAVYGASSDGSVIAGQVYDYGGPPYYTVLPRGYRWTQSTGWQSVPIPCAVEGVSGDGTTIFGEEWVPDIEHPYSARAFYWRPPAAPQYLSSTYEEARAINADGSVIVGSRPNLSALLTHAYRWTAAGGYEILPHLLALESSRAVAFGVSADGAVVLGTESNLNTEEIVTFIWTATEGMQRILAPPGGIDTYLTAAAISGDGRTVLGFAHLPDGSAQAAVWSKDFGPRFVPMGGYTGTAFDSSSFDASVMKSFGDLPAGAGATVVWDPAHGARDLKQLLLGLGVSAVGPYFLGHSVLAQDARTTVGHAFIAENEVGVFVATIPAFCYANCDGSTSPPVLNVNDFICFLNKFAAGDPYVNCDHSTAVPVLNVVDFICFLNKFAAGCL